MGLRRSDRAKKHAIFTIIIIVVCLAIVGFAKASPLDNQKRLEMLTSDLIIAKAEGKKATARYLQKELGKIIIKLECENDR